MPTFFHPALLWGLPIVAVPVLIHLIHLMRRRRIEWAAMEFLAESQRINRRWILLKQLLLLALRMVAVATIVLLVAQPILQGSWGARLGSAKTHHVVLLDDSFSMADRTAESSVFHTAKSVVERIAASAASHATAASFTLLRFSRARDAERPARADLLAEAVDAEFLPRLAELLRALAASQLASGPAEPLESLEQLAPASPDETRLLWLVSDFRERQWRDADDLAGRLRTLADGGYQIHFVHCVDTIHDNLTASELRPLRAVRAAGVPLPMELTVTNRGQTTARQVSVTLEEDGQLRAGVVIDEIRPGKSESRRFDAMFATAGPHFVKARLPSDSLEPDNARYAVVDMSLSVPVLLVDAAPEAAAARFLARALSPGGNVRTGIDPQIQEPRWLADHELADYAAIVLADAGTLDERSVAALEQYVKAGGGAAIFLGPNADPRWLNDRFYRDAAGLMPFRVDGPTELLVDRLERSPDIEVGDHPLLADFTSGTNSFLGAVSVERYMAVAADGSPRAGSAAGVIARLRNGAPLVVEHRFGEGRVMVVLSTAAPVWNNWVRNPSFVVAMLEMVAYLAPRNASDEVRLVGSRVSLTLDPARFQPRYRFSRHDQSGREASESAARATADGLRLELHELEIAGIYDLRLATADGRDELRRFAANVVAEEGDLRLVGSRELAERLKSVSYESHEAGQFEAVANQLASFSLSEDLLYLLLALLVVEQIAAYWSGYHPRRVERTA